MSRVLGIDASSLLYGYDVPPGSAHQQPGRCSFYSQGNGKTKMPQKSGPNRGLYQKKSFPYMAL